MPDLVESMAYAGAMPWHGKGVRVTDTTSLAEVIKLANLDWQVRTDDLYRKLSDDDSEEPAFQKVGAKVVIRADDNKELGIVKPGYVPLQNHEAFAWFEPLIQGGGARFEVAGALQGGRRVFILARIAIDPVDVVPGDPVLPYIVLANSHDGSLAATAAFTEIRVVCENTLNAMLRDDATQALRAVHTKQLHANLELVRDTINLAARRFEATTEQYKAMTRGGMRSTDLRKFVKKIFLPKEYKSAQAKEAQGLELERLMERIEPYFAAGRGQDLPGVRGTVWAAYNGITEYLTHYKGRGNDDSVTNSLLFGQRAVWNKRAFQMAMQYVTTGSV